MGGLIATQLQLMRFLHTFSLFLPQLKKLTDLKTNRNHIILTWILLLCFAAGQFAVWEHQHPVSSNIVTNHAQNPPQKTVITENCQLCDAMHHNFMALNSPVYFAPVTVTHYSYKKVEYAFTSIALILSAGRSPPMAQLLLS